MAELGRDERIERYYNESAWDLAAWLVGAEDEIKALKQRIAMLEDCVAVLRG